MQVSYVELALDLEAYVGRALPAQLEHSLRMTTLPLQQCAGVLRWVVRLHMLTGDLLRGSEMTRC